MSFITRKIRKLFRVELAPVMAAITALQKETAAMNPELLELLKLSQDNNKTLTTIGTTIADDFEKFQAKIDALQLQIANTPPVDTATIASLKAELTTTQGLQADLLAKITPAPTV